MTQEQVNKLFEEYTRFSLEANRTTIGTGLGMAITRNLVKMMNGLLSVESTYGAGSVFTVRIPQKVRQPGFLGKEAAKNLQDFQFTSMQRERHTNINRELMPYGRVLVVDDIKSNLDVAKLLMAPYQLKVETAESGFEAIDIIKSGKEYDIIFLDHMMPKMDGIETIKKIRELEYQQPILALTASAVTGQREMFLATGFDGFISKPIDIRQLNDALNKFVRDKAQEPSESPGQSTADTPQQSDAPNDSSAINIPGIDAEAGLSLYDNDRDIYLQVLRAFIPNALTLMEKMRGFSAGTKDSEYTLADYTIYVHGLKGISAGIGAKKIKDAAQNLEMAAKAGESALVLSENPSFLEEAKELISQIQKWFDEFDKQNPKPLLPCPDITLLARLRKCCEAFDMDGIDDVLDELERANYEKDALLVTWLREKINELEFTDVVSRLEEYA
jgi:CheY-like chemotaxis protein/HPt (histidine-containing phosphotransfer) domain-containing protein